MARCGLRVGEVSDVKVDDFIKTERGFQSTGEIGWSYVSAHDLRRSWATLLIQAGVEPLLVMVTTMFLLFALGWSDYEVFREHYMSIHDASFQSAERAKVDWLQ